MKIEHIDKVDSTNLMALREFARFADGTLLTAGEQTGGIGRRGRSWQSPSGLNLYATYIMKNISFPVGDAMLIGGLATLDSLRKFAPRVELWLKWPNDICCGPLPEAKKPGSGAMNRDTIETEQRKSEDVPSQVSGIVPDARDSRGFRKIAGLLAQTHSPAAANNVDGVVLGMGVNLNMTSEQLSRIDRPAASLLSETGNRIETAIFAEFLLERLFFYRKMAETDSESLFNKWVNANALIGKHVRIALENGESFPGEVLGIREDGAITLKGEDGAERSFVAGDALPASFPS